MNIDLNEWLLCYNDDGTLLVVNGQFLLKKINEEEYLQVDDTDEARTQLLIPLKGENTNEANAEVNIPLLPDLGMGDEPDLSLNTEDLSGSTFKWTKTAVLLLLDLYDENKDNAEKGKITKKKMYEKIAAMMKLKDVKVTGPQCKSKLESLKKHYKTIKDHNKKSGNDRKDWNYLDRMDEIFGKQPWVQPLSTVSSTGGNNAEDNSENIDCDPLKSLSTSVSQAATCKVSPKITRNKRLADLLMKQHEERRKQRAETIDLLRTLVSSLVGKKDN